MNHTIAIIIGRAGSRGLPGKNHRVIAGRPSIAWSVDAARATPEIDTTIVSTDGEMIAAAARDADADAVIQRPANLAGDTTPVIAAVRHALATIEAQLHRRYDIVVILYANVPVRPSDLLTTAVSMLRESGADSVQSYARVGKHHPWWMVDLDAEGRVTPRHTGAVDRRQDLPEVFLPDGGVIAVQAKHVRDADVTKPHAFFGADRRGVTTKSGDVIDIDDAVDCARAEHVLSARAKSTTSS